MHSNSATTRVRVVLGDVEVAPGTIAPASH